MKYTTSERIAHALVGALMFGIIGWFIGRPIGLGVFAVIAHAAHDSLPAALLYACVYGPFVLAVLMGGVVAYCRTSTLDDAHGWVETIWATLSWPHRK